MEFSHVRLIGATMTGVRIAAYYEIHVMFTIFSTDDEICSLRCMRDVCFIDQSNSLES